MTEPIKTPSEGTTINTALADLILKELGQNVFLCYQCVKCTSGCPMSEFFDWQPNQIMRAVQLGQTDIALESETPWLCANCQTCTTRCPQGLDIAGIMGFLTREAVSRGIKPTVPEVSKFQRSFMHELKMWGRSYELGLMAELKLRTGNITGDLDLAPKMFARNKLALLPSIGHPPKKVKAVPDPSKVIGYYPGCSLHSTAREYNISTMAVSEALGLELVEPKGWVCCGSSPAHRQEPEEALRLPIENLALMEAYGLTEVTMPCAACFNHTKMAQYELRHDAQKAEQINHQTSHHYQDKIKVKTIIETFQEHAGKEKVAQTVKKPLKGLKVVAYYGCLLTRPPQVTEAEHPENPTGMDDLLTALGAEVIDWSYKTTCCGASHSLSRPDIVHTLSKRLIEHARASGADAIVMACPLCHTNLDARQTQMKLDTPMPALYLTQLMAIAFGIAEKACLEKNLIDPKPLLKAKDLL